MKSLKRINQWAKQGFENFILPEEVTAPYTTIQNRAKVKTPSVFSVFGNERISFNGGIGLLNGEFGPWAFQ